MSENKGIEEVLENLCKAFDNNLEDATENFKKQNEMYQNEKDFDLELTCYQKDFTKEFKKYVTQVVNSRLGVELSPNDISYILDEFDRYIKPYQTELTSNQ
jgi:hypothetical protein